MDNLASLLRLDRDDHDTCPPEDAEPDGTAPPLAVVALPAGRQLSIGEQAQVVLWMAWRTARRRTLDAIRRDGGLPRWLMTRKAPSVLEQDEYARSRAWVPPGCEDGFADKAGTAYHWVIGRPGVALGQSIAGLAARPLRFCIALLVLAVITAALILAFA